MIKKNIRFTVFCLLLVVLASCRSDKTLALSGWSLSLNKQSSVASYDIVCRKEKVGDIVYPVPHWLGDDLIMEKIKNIIYVRNPSGQEVVSINAISGKPVFSSPYVYEDKTSGKVCLIVPRVDKGDILIRVGELTGDRYDMFVDKEYALNELYVKYLSVRFHNGEWLVTKKRGAVKAPG